MILPFQGKMPAVAASAFIVDSARVIGDVVIGEESSVWFNAVVRGDVNFIRVGRRTNIQDGCVLHVSRHTYSLTVENEVTVGHGVILHGCVVRSRCLIGMGAVIMDGVEIDENCIVGAGALVTSKTVIPPRSLVIGSPARVKRELTDEEVRSILNSAEHYVDDIKNYRS
jgi:carbonic anhydrase/acetyltransferase-like protein (isoleucine patch superfamily)